MRKILIGILVCLMLIGSSVLMTKGASVINLCGFKELAKKNNEIEKSISELSNVISVSYPDAETSLKSAASVLMRSKTEYENQALLSKSNSTSYISQTEKYDIDYLWTKLGNYAKEEGVIIKIEVVTSEQENNIYTLNFTTTGTYVGTTNFIYDIENDSKLGFKIDNLKMVASTDYVISTTFTCKEIPISITNVEGNGTENKAQNGGSTTNAANPINGATSAMPATSTSTPNTVETTATATGTASATPTPVTANPTNGAAAPNVVTNPQPTEEIEDNSAVVTIP